MAKIVKMEMNISFKRHEEALYNRIMGLRSKSSFMKDAAAEKFEREDAMKELQNQSKKPTLPRGFGI